MVSGENETKGYSDEMDDLLGKLPDKQNSPFKLAMTRSKSI